MCDDVLWDVTMYLWASSSWSFKRWYSLHLESVQNDPSEHHKCLIFLSKSWHFATQLLHSGMTLLLFVPFKIGPFGNISRLFQALLKQPI